MKKADIGLIGLAVMGENLVMNMESKGFTVAVFNRTTEKVDKCGNRFFCDGLYAAATALAVTVILPLRRAVPACVAGSAFRVSRLRGRALSL